MSKDTRGRGYRGVALITEGLIVMLKMEDVSKFNMSGRGNVLTSKIDNYLSRRWNIFKSSRDRSCRYDFEIWINVDLLGSYKFEEKKLHL